MMPVLFREKKDCCGCFACYVVCPQKAIEMREDEEGFLYPCILVARCVGCLRCETVCPVEHKKVCG